MLSLVFILGILVALAALSEDAARWRDADVCMGCGNDNPHGLKLRFGWEGDEMVTTYVPAPEHQGWAGYAHGGMLALVLDEVMAQSVFASGYLAPTAEITTRFRLPAPVGEPLRVSAERPRGRRLLTCRAEARDGQGRIVAEATAKFIPQRVGEDEKPPWPRPGPENNRG
jgi:acyl-coenzyme A thioesterase PaaI-like protein